MSDTLLVVGFILFYLLIPLILLIIALIHLSTPWRSRPTARR